LTFFLFLPSFKKGKKKKLFYMKRGRKQKNEMKEKSYNWWIRSFLPHYKRTNTKPHKRTRRAGRTCVVVHDRSAAADVCHHHQWRPP
jgi:hypothetical protein